MKKDLSVAFIPARGGSKRLPGKNTRKLGGHPLIAFSIAFARCSKMDLVYVSTDDDTIAEISSAYGAEVLMRPPDLASDTASTAAVAADFLKTLHRQDLIPEVFVTLQPTNPLRPENIYREALSLFQASACDSVISVSLNKHKLGSLKPDSTFVPVSYQPGTRSQDLTELYYENGLIYLSKPSNILEEAFFGKNIKTLPAGEPFSYSDIDTLFDFELNEYFLNKYPQHFFYLTEWLQKHILK